jgi:hypothetical protein
MHLGWNGEYGMGFGFGGFFMILFLMQQEKHETSSLASAGFMYDTIHSSVNLLSGGNGDV